MYNQIDNVYLYSALRLTLTYRDEYGNQKFGSGTGFMVRGSGDKSAIITNRHVLEPGYADAAKRHWSVEKICFEGYGNQRTFFKAEFRKYEIRYPADYDEDVAAITIVDVVVLDGNISGLSAVNLALDLIADDHFFELLNVGDFVVFPGYPEWHDKNEKRPILRSGIISSDPTRNYTGPKLEPGARRLAFEAFSFSGSSGSPVFALAVGFTMTGDVHGGNYRPLRLIGITAGHFETTDGRRDHSGVSYLFKGPVIREILA